MPSAHSPLLAAARPDAAAPRVPALRGLSGSRALWCVLAAFAVSANFLAHNPGALTATLGDTDDAARLIEVRTLLGGASWFDMTLPQFGGSVPLVSHWSRLIDAPLAGLLAVLTAVLGGPAAEVALRLIWPAALFAGFLALLTAEVEALAGRRAAWLLLGLAALSTVGFIQFNPGRIDHHNAMILCTVVGLVRLSRAGLDAQAGRRAGVLLGLALAIGYEPLLYIGAAFAGATLLALFQPQWREGVARAATAMAATLALAFVLTVAPHAWLAVKCDALSLNAVVLSACGAAALRGLARLSPGARPWHAVAIVALPVAAGLAAFAALEPKCLAGPFGQVDAAIGPIWLDAVLETRPLPVLFQELPDVATVIALALALSALAAARLWHAGESCIRALCALFAISAVLACWQFKLASYALWLGAVLLAIAIARLRPMQRLPDLGTQTLALLAVNQSTLTLLTGLAMAPPASAAAGTVPADPAICMEVATLAPLAQLPPGLVAADVNLGPAIVALSPHTVLSAPYHRMSHGILAAHAILWGRASEAEALMRTENVRYVVDCTAAPAPNAARASGADEALLAILRAGRSVAFLEAVPLTPAEPALKVWRLTNPHSP